MKKKIFLVLYIVAYSVIAQDSGVVTYSISLKEKLLDNEKNDNGISLVNKAVIENLNLFKFNLEFLKNKSLFKQNSIMDDDRQNMKIKIASAMLESENEYFVDTDKKIKNTYLNVYGEKFIIIDSLAKWNLSNDSKQINSYKCYRATTVRVVVNSKGKFVKKVECWYAPEIPLSHGPKGYGGLPGLIIELTEDKYIYTVKNIKFKKIKNIKKPAGGIIVTEAKLLKMGKNFTFGKN